MRDLIFAAGAVLAVEGLLLAMAPERLRTLIETIEALGSDRLRLAGLVAAAFGVMLLALGR